MPSGHGFLMDDGNVMLCDTADAHLFRGRRLVPFVRKRARAPDAIYASAKSRGYGTGHGPAHKMVVPPMPGLEIDHINGDTLNNCRSNLRYATRQQNSANSITRSRSSRYKGVCYDKSREGMPCGNVWLAGIKHNYVRINIGRFKTEEEAARAYDEAAVRLFGAFARTNFPR